MKKIAVVLSGCGFQDGAEITESISTLMSLSEFGAEYKIFAPDINFQAKDHLKDHLSAQEQGMRNTLSESARIARGSISDVSSLNSNEFNGVVFPGGYGVALHLCDWGLKGAACSVNPEVERVIKEFSDSDKPIVAICISPVLVAKVLGRKNITVTIGNDPETAAEIEKTGSRHEKCAVNDYVSDREHKIITTPAYMYDHAKPHEVFSGIHGAIKELVEMA